MLNQGDRLPEQSVVAATSIELPDNRPDLREIVMHYIHLIRQSLEGNNDLLYLGLERELPLRFFTLSAWTGRNALTGFITSEVHQKAVESTPSKAGEIVAVTWEPATIPFWLEAKERISAEKRHLSAG